MRFLGLLLAALLTYSISALADVGNLNTEQMRDLMKRGVPVVDVRTPGEWNQTGVIEGSHLLTFFDERGHSDPAAWMAALSKIAKPNDPVILVCRTGHRTAKITTFLDKQVGYKKVSHLIGGITQWISEGNPVIPRPEAH